jgi:hypothetical protein
MDNFSSHYYSDFNFHPTNPNSINSKYSNYSNYFNNSNFINSNSHFEILDIHSNIAFVTSLLQEKLEAE